MYCVHLLVCVVFVLWPYFTLCAPNYGKDAPKDSLSSRATTRNGKIQMDVLDANQELALPPEAGRSESSQMVVSDDLTFREENRALNKENHVQEKENHVLYTKNRVQNEETRVKDEENRVLNEENRVEPQVNHVQNEENRVKDKEDKENLVLAEENENRRVSNESEENQVDTNRRPSNETEDEDRLASNETEDDNGRDLYKTKDEDIRASNETEEEDRLSSYETEDENRRASNETEDEDRLSSYETENENNRDNTEDGNTRDNTKDENRHASYAGQVWYDEDKVCWDMMDDGLNPHGPSQNWTRLRFKCGDVRDDDSGACVCIQCNETQVVAMCNNTKLHHVPKFLNLTIDYLMFNDNHLELIHDSRFFRNVPDLRRLDLDYNYLKSLPKDAFKLLTKLEMLKLNYNVYLDISKHIEPIFSVKTLRVLDISNTYFGVDFKEDTFVKYPLPQLERLYVHHTTMRSWDVGMFQPLTKLQYIAVNSNDMKSINTKGLVGSINVTSVVLAVNDMYEFPYTCHRGSRRSFFPQLTYLDLHGNRLHGTLAKHEDHPCLPSLTHLNMSENNLEYLHTNTFGEENFPLLQVLYLDRMSVIREFYAYAFNNSHLQFLTMRYNNIDFSHSPDPNTAVNDSAFLGLTGLLTLQLEHNWGLTDGRLAELFADSKLLQHLYLANTFMDVITPDTFKIFPELVTLSLYHNPITTLTPGSFDSLTKLQFLDLSTCGLVTLSEHHFSWEIRHSLVHLDLSQNRFRCDCDLMWLRDWMVRDKARFSHSYSVYECQTPRELRGTNITEYKLQKQSCLMSHTVASVIITVVTLWVLLLTSVPCLYRYRWHIRLMLYEAFRGTNQRLLRPADSFRYDVYVSYAKEDLPWVRSHLESHLETRVGLRLCIHERDFMLGDVIVDNIFSSVQESRKILMVFSRHFARSEWCQFELAMCLQHVLDNDDTLVILCIDDVTSVGCSLLTETMMAVLLTTNYIQWEVESDAVRSFWGRLRLALYEILPLRKKKKSSRARKRSKVFSQPRGVVNSLLAQQSRHHHLRRSGHVC